ncbi:MAG: low molecular weight phosphatase family protein [Alphaproteobacteria bacterium]
MSTLPGSILFACTMNAVRSPMAEGLMKHYFGNRVYVDSVGVRPADIDPFAVGVMGEIGIDISGHEPKLFDQLEDSSFDIVVSLSPEAQHSAVEMTRTMACELEFWHTFDATFVQGRRDQIVTAYREVRDFLQAKILDRFGAPTASANE